MARIGTVQCANLVDGTFSGRSTWCKMNDGYQKRGQRSSFNMTSLSLNRSSTRFLQRYLLLDGLRVRARHHSGIEDKHSRRLFMAHVSWAIPRALTMRTSRTHGWHGEQSRRENVRSVRNRQRIPSIAGLLWHRLHVWTL